MKNDSICGWISYLYEKGGQAGVQKQKKRCTALDLKVVLHAQCAWASLSDVMRAVGQVRGAAQRMAWAMRE